jgi:hypothetical protein
MKTKLVSLFFLVVGLLIVGAPVFAHHGTSITYKVDQTITMTGTITEFAYSYPHPQIYFDVKGEDGKVQRWGSEFGPTPLMMRNLNWGWSRTSIKVGDEVKITCNPHKVPGATACLLKELVINGKLFPLNQEQLKQVSAAK